MVSDVVFWLVAAVFYLPFHLLPPLGYIVVMVDAPRRPPLLRRALVVGALFAVAAFATAILTWQEHRALAMSALLVAFVPPWLDTWRGVAKAAAP